MFCSNCGKEVPAGSEFCSNCGTRLSGAQAAPPPSPSPASTNVYVNAAPAVTTGGISPKSKFVVAILAFFLGQLGIHRFYVGKIGTGIVMIVLMIIGYATMAFYVGIAFLVALGIWVLIDFIMALMGKFKDKNGLLIKN